MSQAGISHVRIGGEVRGPLRPAQLSELVEGGAITPATEAAAGAAGPWSPIKDWPECATLFPPRPVLTFKAAEFEAVNLRPTPPVDHREMIAWANLPPPAGVAKNPAPAAPKPEPVNEVLEIVRAVAKEEAKYEKPMVFPTRRHQHRRLIHFLMLAAAGSAVVAGVGFIYRPLDELSMTILCGWTILYIGGLAMIMLVHLPRS
jgi:hypothetical protein